MAVIGGFLSDLSMTWNTDGNFGNVVACVLFFGVSIKTVVSLDFIYSSRAQVLY